MKQNTLLVSILSLILHGCGLIGVESQEARVKNIIEKADQQSKQRSKQYEIKQRSIAKYIVYRYKEELSDPFRARDFVMENVPAQNAEVVESKPAKQKCLPPSCSPPDSHPTELLEQYNLNQLEFVGTLAYAQTVALIKTPDLGIVRVSIGQYMGKNYGKVIAIKPSALVLQEKLLQDGLWQSKKTILVIQR